MKYIHYYNSPLGLITEASDGKKLTGLWFEGQKYYLSSLNKEYTEQDLPIFSQTDNWLDIYFSGEEPGFTPPISINTSEFRKTVFDILLSIPYGHTITYGEIAGIIANNKGVRCISAQAVGGAVGHNPISLIIPCHRVLGAHGKLTGYAGGINKKEQLLKLEKSSETA